jgi:hypothetical protein
MAKSNASVQDLAGASASLSGEYANKVQIVLFALSEKNESMMLSLRAIYIAYSSNPCANDTMFTKAIEKMVLEQNKMTHIRILIRGLVELTQQNPEDKARILDVFLYIVNMLGSEERVSAVAAEGAIQQQAEITQTWLRSRSEIEQQQIPTGADDGESGP